jgi:hypothetical protein
MGFACPDNGSCDPAFYGFYKQVNQAARHFKNFYDLNPSWYIPFRPGINYVQYNPNAGCGGTSVNILNSATSALYSYTPYQPNAAALSNLYGTGDGCSAYGNRNFWRDFNNWFKTTLVDYKNVALNNKGAVLSAGQRLNAGDYLISENGSNILTLQEDGNLVLYRSGSPVWSSGTWLKQVGYLEMQPDGNLVIYSSPGNPIWASNTVGKNGSMLKMQSDSNLVMYTPSNSPVWHTGTWIDISQQNILYSTLRTGRLYQGQAIYSPNKKYRLTIQTDGNLVIYTATRPIWATNTWLKPVKFVAMQSDGNLVLYDETMKPYWDSGTWNRGLSRLVMQDDGNLVIYNSVGSPTWASNTVGR